MGFPLIFLLFRGFLTEKLEIFQDPACRIPEILKNFNKIPRENRREGRIFGELGRKRKKVFAKKARKYKEKSACGSMF